MNDRYFIEVTFEKDTDYTLLAGRCIKVLHGFSKRNHTNQIGLCFPNWCEKSVGHSIAFVSSYSHELVELCSQPYFLTMQEIGSFIVSDCSIVEPNGQEVRFIRNQAISNCYLGKVRRDLARAKRRAEARGETFSPRKTEPTDKFLAPFHKVPISSNSNGHDFILHIQRQLINDICDEPFGSYGMATNELHKGSVPALSNFV